MGTESNRMWASASFVGVLIVIGLPLWWKTTEVYRVALPYDKINTFTTLSHAVTTELTVVANDDATADQIVDNIKKEFEESDVIKLNIKKFILPDGLRRTLDSVADDQEAVEEVAGAYDLKKHNTFYVVQRSQLYQDVWLSRERLAFFKDATASRTLVEVLRQWVYQTSVLEGGRLEKPDVARQTRFPPGEEYHVVLSVVHPKPDALAVEFHAEDAVEDYIGSFVDELSELHNFTLKSQWLYLLDFDFQAKEVKDTSEWGRHFAVRQERLQLMLTRLEERAAPQVSSRPTVNLALYLLPCHQAPLLIYDNNDKPIKSPVQAFMSPKWGGVVMYSPSAADCRAAEPTSSPDVRLIMGTFLAQLRTLLGIADTPSIEGAAAAALRSVRARRWELDALLRLRTLEQLAAAHAALASLAQLLGEISNIVINDEVGASINSAVKSIEAAEELLSKDLLAAYRLSLRAHIDAETAFMEPSLLALLYFPDDQKYAIYIPLFLPIMFPVILSLKNLLLWFRGKAVHKEKTE
ncbi:GPI transamidase component PIG-S isoform X2 [Galleria mellonella]|uniref:GPI transamidase component PIG-S isoform X2 n=1 Tax=Galleria mellonella TaxID=7137 RepID=A0ABM3MKY2_GALME|nr:GPI transamidase component PIG-S isoform X2 [Galleria mellonella]